MRRKGSIVRRDHQTGNRGCATGGKHIISGRAGRQHEVAIGLGQGLEGLIPAERKCYVGYRSGRPHVVMHVAGDAVLVYHPEEAIHQRWFRTAVVQHQIGEVKRAGGIIGSARLDIEDDVHQIPAGVQGLGGKAVHRDLAGDGGVGIDHPGFAGEGVFGIDAHALDDVVAVGERELEGDDVEIIRGIHGLHRDQHLRSRHSSSVWRHLHLQGPHHYATAGYGTYRRVNSIRDDRLDVIGTVGNAGTIPGVAVYGAVL